VTAPLAVQLPDELLDEIAHRAAALLADQRTQPSPWLDVDGAARHVGYTDNLTRGRRRIYDLVSRGELQPRRDGKRLLFKAEALDRYLEENT